VAALVAVRVVALAAARVVVPAAALAAATNAKKPEVASPDAASELARETIGTPLLRPEILRALFGPCAGIGR
jgi:hypothetical protein